ncbi:alpha/beta fold hydrolase [Maricaulis sp. D1M11]|uniref:alpha/beta fold hydrolase n=1 Tax=Maricaulis sp. D1M11 TaxID=3076117 RepID=UPI0039B51DE8
MAELMIAGLALVLLIGLTVLARHKIRMIETRFAPTGTFIDVDGTRLHYRRTGPRSSVPLLVLHGASSNHLDSHEALGEALADQDVIWLDRPGLGWSERPAKEPWSPADEAALIARFLDALDIHTIDLMGHSWGAAIAARFALDHSERVRCLVLLAPALAAYIGDPGWFNSVSRWPVFGPLFVHLILPLAGEKALDDGASRAFAPETAPGDYSTRTALPLILRPRAWMANASDMVHANPHLELQERRYHELDLPVFILAGPRDSVVWTHRHTTLTARRLPDAIVHLPAQAGHNPHHSYADDILAGLAQARTRALSRETHSSAETA